MLIAAKHNHNKRLNKIYSIPQPIFCVKHKLNCAAIHGEWFFSMKKV
jgi:hypothetical protein